MCPCLNRIFCFIYVASSFRIYLCRFDVGEGMDGDLSSASSGTFCCIVFTNLGDRFGWKYEKHYDYVSQEHDELRNKSSSQMVQIEKRQNATSETVCAPTYCFNFEMFVRVFLPPWFIRVCIPPSKNQYPSHVFVYPLCIPSFLTTIFEETDLDLGGFDFGRIWRG